MFVFRCYRVVNNEISTMWYCTIGSTSCITKRIRRPQQMTYVSNAKSPGNRVCRCTVLVLVLVPGTHLCNKCGQRDISESILCSRKCLCRHAILKKHCTVDGIATSLSILSTNVLVHMGRRGRTSYLCDTFGWEIPMNTTTTPVLVKIGRRSSITCLVFGE